MTGRPVDMLEAKLCVMRVCYLRTQDHDTFGTCCDFPSMTATFLEDDNLFIQEGFPHFHRNLVYDFVKGEMCSEMHSSQSLTRLPNVHQRCMVLGPDSRNPSQQNSLYNHLIPSQGQSNTRCAEATQWA